jgi:hypothetical protein
VQGRVVGRDSLSKCQVDVFGAPPSYIASLWENLTDDILSHAEKCPGRAGFSRRVGEAGCREVKLPD